jgi:hypothetical protein
MERTKNPLLHRLQQTLETGAPREEIAEALKAAETLGDGLPPLLAFRAQERIDADRFLDRRRIAFGVGVALFLFLTGISFFGLTTLMRFREANRDAIEFQELVDDEKWEEAKALLAGLSDSDLAKPPFADGQALVRDAIELEQERADEFEKLVGEIKANPSLLLDEDTISRLDELAKSDEEKKISKDVSAQADEQRLLREAGRVENQTEQFESLQRAVDEFFETEAKTLGAQQLAERTRELQRGLQEFIAKNHLSNPGMAETAKQTADLLSRESKLSSKKGDRESMFNDITQAVGQAVSYRRSLRRFAEAFPNDPVSLGMSDALRVDSKGGQWVDATESWIALLEDAVFTNPDSADSNKTEEWLTNLQLATELDQSHPFSDRPTSLRSFYQAIAKRKQATTQLRELLQSKWLGQMYVYSDLRDQRYYSDVSPQRDSPTLHVVEYFADLSLNRKEKNFGSRFREQILPRVRVAGHSTYASQAANRIASTNSNDFTPTVYRLLSDLRSMEVGTEIDPILKLDLLRRLILIGSEGSVPIRAGFADLAEALGSGDFDWDANWMSPGDSDPEVVELRNEARTRLDGVRDWDARVKRMGGSFRTFREPRSPAPQWVGWVSKKNGEYLVAAEERIPAGSVFVVHRHEDSTKMVKIPRTEAGVFKIDDAKAQLVGALVCVMPTSGR